MAEERIIIAGFGGQGILMLGKLLAHAGMMEGKQVTWLPSYGPEMRGGTANCNVIVSDDPIGAPIVTEATCVIAMNLPSLDRFESFVAARRMAAAEPLPHPPGAGPARRAGPRRSGERPRAGAGQPAGRERRHARRLPRADPGRPPGLGRRRDRRTCSGRPSSTCSAST